jgi:hypothetical protein
MINKEKALYVGLGVFLLLVVLCSNKKVKYDEVKNVAMEGSKDFNSSALPKELRPPYRVQEGEELQLANPKSMNGLKSKFGR